MMILGIYYRIKSFFLNTTNDIHESMDSQIHGFILAYMNADMRGKIWHFLIISLKASSFLLSASQVRPVLQLFESQSISHISPYFERKYLYGKVKKMRNKVLLCPKVLAYYIIQSLQHPMIYVSNLTQVENWGLKSLNHLQNLSLCHFCNIVSFSSKRQKSVL